MTNDDVLFTAVDMLAQRRKKGTAPTFAPPRTVIFCYQPGLLRYAVKRWRGQKKNGFFGDFYLLRTTSRKFGTSGKFNVGIIGNFGIGAPVTAVLLEDLVAFGVKQFIIVGLAGGLQAGLQAGDLIIADRAIRDEGTSSHYQPHSQSAAPSARLSERLRQTCEANSLPCTVGPTWTTDAPYRETKRQVSQHQQEGVLTVEMEAAAFFTVAAYLSVEAAALFSIGDTLQNGRWQLDFDIKRSENGLQTWLNTVIQTCQP